jgi:tetratricopeptide (TPR) repeat protein
VDLALTLVKRYPEVPHYRQALAASYHRLGASLTQNNPGEAEEPLAQALRVFRQLVSDFPTVPAFQENVAVTHFDLAILLNETGRRHDAEAAFKDAIVILERLADNFPDQSDYRRRLASCCDSLGSMLETIGRIEDAGQAYRRALAIRRQLVAAYPYVGRYQAELAWQLAVCPLTDLRDAEGALARARTAVELSPGRATHWVVLGVARYRTGDWTAAVKSLEKSAEFPSHPRSRDWFLAMAHWQLGDKETARKYYDQANARMAETAPKDDEQRRFRAEAAGLLGIPQTPDTEVEKEKRPESK